MIREIRQKDVDDCIRLLGDELYPNLKTRFLAFMQFENNLIIGEYENDELRGFAAFSFNGFDVNIQFLVIKNPNDLAGIENLINEIKAFAKLRGAKGVFINITNLDKEILKTLAIVEQYSLE